eukprot:1184957-Prorocentrum_minimum.AAC.6
MDRAAFSSCELSNTNTARLDSGLGFLHSRVSEAHVDPFLDVHVARPPFRDPPPGDRNSQEARFGPEIRPGVGARPGNVREVDPHVEGSNETTIYNQQCDCSPPGLARRSDEPSAARRPQGGRWEEAAHRQGNAIEQKL